MWHVVNARTRNEYVSGTDAGRVVYTHDLTRALHFERQDDARCWIERHAPTFGALALMRTTNKNPVEAGKPDGVNSCDHYERNEVEPHHESSKTVCRPARPRHPRI